MLIVPERKSARYPVTQTAPRLHIGETTELPVDQLEKSLGQVDGRPVSIGPNGAFCPDTASLAMRARKVYDAAQLADDGVNPFAGLSAVTLTSAFDQLNRQLADVGRAASTDEDTLRMKSGSVTLLLSLIQVAPKNVRDRAINLYLGTLEVETEPRFRISMMLNLLNAKTPLNPAQASQLARLREEIAPSRPPYEKWFANGNQAIHVRHYIHEDFWDSVVWLYADQGFTRANGPNGTVTFTKKIGDGTHPPVDFTVECTKVKSYDSDVKILSDMNRKDIQLELYSGHSSLGGNIKRALDVAPTLDGDKLVIQILCRGIDNVAEFTNKFPTTPLLTTRMPAHAEGMRAAVSAAYQMIAERNTYTSMTPKLRGTQRPPNDGNAFVPDDLAKFAYVDLDNDGRIDWRGVPDRLFNIEKRAVGSALSFSPGISRDPSTADGQAVVSAVNFANTMLFYHVSETARGSTPIPLAFTDHAIAGGYFKSDSDTFMRVKEEVINGETFYRISINSRFADADPDVIGMRTIYELVMYEALKRSPTPSPEDRIRALVLAFEWSCYITGYGTKMIDLVRGLADYYGWPATVGAGFLDKAAHAGVYGDDRVVRAVAEKLGAADFARVR